MHPMRHMVGNFGTNLGCEVTSAKHAVLYDVTWENMGAANGQTGGKNSSSTFILTAFISFGLFFVLDGFGLASCF